MEMIEQIRTDLGSLLKDKRVRLVLVSIACIALVIFSIKCIRKSIGITDSYVFYRAGRAILEGSDLYKADWRPFVNPPFFAVFMVPFSLLDIVGFSIVWHLFNVALLISILYLSVYLLRNHLRDVPLAMLLLPLLMTFRPLESNMTLGQCNLIVVFFSLAGLALFKKGLPFLGGLAIAVGVSIKLTPGLFLIYFAYRKQWRITGGIAVGIVLFSLVVPVLVLGLGDGTRELVTWWTITRTSSLVVDSVDGTFYIPGQTVRSLLLRLLTPTVISTRSEPIYVNMASLSLRAAEFLTYGVSLLMLAVLAWNFRGRLKPQSVAVAAIEFALVLLTMTMISPFSRKAHYVSMLFPSMVLLHYLFERDGFGESTKRLVKTIVTATIIIMLVSSRGIVGRTVAIYLNGYGIIMICASLVWICLIVLLRKERDFQISQESSPC